MKSKTERTLEAMDAIYKEVRARKRKEFWQTCNKVFSSFLKSPYGFS